MRPQFLIPLIVFGLVAISLGIGLGLHPAEIPSALIGKPVPQFALDGVKDAAPGLSAANLKGQVTVVNVFASWCDPCKAEAPILKQEQQRLKGQDATILGVTYLDNSSDSEKFVRQQHISYPVVRDVSGNFVRSFGTTGVPETFVINRRGRIAALRRFQIDSKWLSQTLPAILAQKA